MSVYSDPGSYGLKLVYSLDVGDSYEFDVLCVWQEERTGRLLMGFDSG